MSRQTKREIRCDHESLVTAKFDVTLWSSNTVRLTCRNGYQVAGKIDWVAIEHRARAEGWTIRGPVGDRKHYCPEHGKRQETDHER